MQVIAASAPVTRARRVALVRSGIAAVLLLGVGATLAWILVTSQLVARFMPSGRPDLAETAVGMLAWGLAILVPGSLILVGLARSVATVDGFLRLRPRTHLPRLARDLGPELIAATGLRLPDGRRIHELVLGPFGVAVLGEVPPPTISRHEGRRWEVRDAKGRWIPIEGPLDRTARDADHVRRWLADDDRDFIVRVYAVVVTSNERVDRTPACAVVSPRELAAWLAAIAPQRGLTPARMDHLRELLREVAVSS
jgi:hypothetical protein